MDPFWIGAIYSISFDILSIDGVLIPTFQIFLSDLDRTSPPISTNILSKFKLSIILSTAKPLAIELKSICTLGSFFLILLPSISIKS